MAAGGTQILKEYLVALGYTVNEPSKKKFDDSLLKTKFNVESLLKTLIGVGTAATAMATLYARAMERMYYSSIKAETSVENLQALNFGGLKVGIKDLAGMVERFASTLRSNPQLEAFINGFGVKSAGRERGDVMIEFIEKLLKLPQFAAASAGSMFGFSEEDLYLLRNGGLDKLKEAMQARKDLNANAGVDMQEQARIAKEYADALRNTAAAFEVMQAALMKAMLPALRQVNEELNQYLIGQAKILGRYTNSKDKGWTDWLNDVVTGNLAKLGMKVGTMPVSPDTAKRIKAGEVDKSPIRYPVVGGTANEGGVDAYALFAQLEKQFGLPPGLLDSIWDAESGRGWNKGPSRAGAMGDFQFMPETAKEYGVDVNSFESSARGAAKKLANLLKWAGGDLDKAVAGYNLGEGNYAKYSKKGYFPQETADYVRKTTGGEINVRQETNITVQSPDPAAAGQSVAREQNRVNSEMTRNFRSPVQ